MRLEVDEVAVKSQISLLYVNFSWKCRLDSYFYEVFRRVVVEEEKWLRFTSSSFKSSFAFRLANAFTNQLFDWKNHMHLLQIIRLKTKRYI